MFRGIVVEGAALRASRGVGTQNNLGGYKRCVSTNLDTFLSFCRTNASRASSRTFPKMFCGIVVEGAALRALREVGTRNYLGGYKRCTLTNLDTFL